MQLLPHENYDELLRLAALSRSGALEVSSSQRLDDIATAAKAIFEATAGMVTLIDADSQIFKAAAGVDLMRTSRSASFCSHCIAYRNLLWIEDTHEDPRVSDNPFVTGSPSLRFYAGAPIRDIDGWLLGTVCVVDTRPRHFDPILSAILEGMAELASRYLRDQAGLIEGGFSI